jgi:hypothetical protein
MRFGKPKPRNKVVGRLRYALQPRRCLPQVAAVQGHRITASETAASAGFTVLHTIFRIPAGLPGRRLQRRAGGTRMGRRQRVEIRAGGTQTGRRVDDARKSALAALGRGAGSTTLGNRASVRGWFALSPSRDSYPACDKRPADGSRARTSRSLRCDFALPLTRRSHGAPSACRQRDPIASLPRRPVRVPPARSDRVAPTAPVRVPPARSDRVAPTAPRPSAASAIRSRRSHGAEAPTDHRETCQHQCGSQRIKPLRECRDRKHLEDGHRRGSRLTVICQVTPPGANVSAIAVTEDSWSAVSDRVTVCGLPLLEAPMSWSPGRRDRRRPEDVFAPPCNSAWR